MIRFILSLSAVCALAFVAPTFANASCGSCPGDEGVEHTHEEGHSHDGEAACGHCAGDADAECTCAHAAEGEEAAAEGEEAVAEDAHASCEFCQGDAEAECTCGH